MSSFLMMSPGLMLDVSIVSSSVVVENPSHHIHRYSLPSKSCLVVGFENPIECAIESARKLNVMDGWTDDLSFG